MNKRAFKKLLILTSVILITFSGKVFSQEDPIKLRQDSMKQVGAASKTLGNMVRGRAEYNPEDAQEALTQIVNAMVVFVENFPEGSDAGKTEAAPKIWEDMEGFQAASEKFKMDAEVAIEPAGESLDALKVSFEKVAANCKSCHMTYRE